MWSHSRLQERQVHTSLGFIHIADRYTTFCKLAGIDSGPGRFPVNSMDVWPIITG